MRNTNDNGMENMVQTHNIHKKKNHREHDEKKCGSVAKLACAPLINWGTLDMVIYA